MPNTNFQTIHQMGSAISNVVKQATGRDPVANIDMDYVTVAQNKTIGEMMITGNPASFHTGNSVPIQRLLIGMNPKQAGSGDPSPENVRPITGWTGVNVIRTGRNLIDDSIKYLYETNYIGIGNEYAFTIFLKAGQYTFSVEFLNNAHYGAYYREENDSANSVIWTPASSASTKTFTIEKDGMYRLWLYSSSSVSVDNVGKCQLELGSSATPYEEYNGTNISVTFPNPPGTVYGGTLDLTTGVLTVDMACVTFDGSNDEEWIKYGTQTPAWYRQSWRTSNLPYQIKDRSTILEGCIGNGAVELSSKSETAEEEKDKITCRPTSYKSTYFYIFTPLSLGMELSDLKSMLAENPLQFCYPLETELTYQLTPQQIQTLIGDNVILTDGDTLEVMYYQYGEVI